MYCQNCGKEISDNAVICVHCGCATGNYSKNNKSMLVAILLWLFLGGLGLHRFYLGHTASGTVMLLCTLFCWLVIPAIVVMIWWFIDIILIVSGNLKTSDGTDLT